MALVAGIRPCHRRGALYAVLRRARVGGAERRRVVALWPACGSGRPPSVVGLVEALAGGAGRLRGALSALARVRPRVAARLASPQRAVVAPRARAAAIPRLRLRPRLGRDGDLSRDRGSRYSRDAGPRRLGVGPDGPAATRRTLGGCALSWRAGLVLRDHSAASCL